MDDLVYPFMYGFSLDTGHEISAEETLVTGLGLGGTFTVECFDSDGNLRWSARAKNIIPNAVLNDILNVYFAQGANTSAFYIGMVDNSGFSGFAATDTMASHTGWAENTATSLSARPTWTPGAAASQSISNPSAVVITMNAIATIRGFFMTSNNTLGGTSGNLVATAAIGSGPQSTNSGDVLKITYALNGTTS